MNDVIVGVRSGLYGQIDFALGPKPRKQLFLFFNYMQKFASLELFIGQHLVFVISTLWPESRIFVKNIKQLQHVCACTAIPRKEKFLISSLTVKLLCVC